MLTITNWDMLPFCQEGKIKIWEWAEYETLEASSVITLQLHGITNTCTNPFDVDDGTVLIFQPEPTLAF